MAVNPKVLAMRERTDRPGGPELTLVAALEAQAKADSLSGRGLASACGIDRSQWMRVRKGQGRFGPVALAAIVEHYPALRTAAADYLAEKYGPLALGLLAEAAQVAQQRPSASGRGAREGTSRRTACR